MALKLDVRVPVEGAGAWLFLPEEDGLHPTITMAHGLRAPSARNYRAIDWPHRRPFDRGQLSATVQLPKPLALDLIVRKLPQRLPYPNRQQLVGRQALGIWTAV